MTWRTRERARERDVRERDVRDGDSRRVVEEDVGERARGGGAGETRGEGRMRYALERWRRAPRAS